eukprot:2751838-Prymnesium_polylepis.1
MARERLLRQIGLTRDSPCTYHQRKATSTTRTNSSLTFFLCLYRSRLSHLPSQNAMRCNPLALPRQPAWRPGTQTGQGHNAILSPRGTYVWRAWATRGRPQLEGLTPGLALTLFRGD